MEFNENKPIYLQLADRLMDELEQGVLHSGDRIVSVREYAAETGVNANTVMRAYTWLQQQGIVYNKRGIGYFFSEDAGQLVAKMRREEFLNNEIGYFFGRLKAIGFTPADLAKKYESYLRNDSK